MIYRLIDLSDENITELKLPGEIANQPEEEAKKEEAAVHTIEKMAENVNDGNTVSAFSFIFYYLIKNKSLLRISKIEISLKNTR